jgi:hypothetical protein
VVNGPEGSLFPANVGEISGNEIVRVSPSVIPIYVAAGFMPASLFFSRVSFSVIPKPPPHLKSLCSGDFTSPASRAACPEIRGKGLRPGEPGPSGVLAFQTRAARSRGGLLGPAQFTHLPTPRCAKLLAIAFCGEYARGCFGPAPQSGLIEEKP